MTVTMEEVRKWLDPEEVDYPKAAAQLGPEAFPYLEELAGSPDAMLASKAVYLAGLIRGERAVRILDRAIGRHEGAVRVAAAAGLENLDQDEAAPLLEKLLADQDAGVRKTAIRSVSAFPSPVIRQKLLHAVEHEAHPGLRALAAKLLGPAVPR